MDKLYPQNKVIVDGEVYFNGDSYKGKNIVVFRGEAFCDGNTLKAEVCPLATIIENKPLYYGDEVLHRDYGLCYVLGTKHIYSYRKNDVFTVDYNKDSIKILGTNIFAYIKSTVDDKVSFPIKRIKRIPTRDLNCIRLYPNKKSITDVLEFINTEISDELIDKVLSDGYLTIKTIEGEVKAKMGCYIVGGTAGEFYPVRPDIFKNIWEFVD